VSEKTPKKTGAARPAEKRPVKKTGQSARPAQRKARPSQWEDTRPRMSGGRYALMALGGCAVIALMFISQMGVSLGRGDPAVSCCISHGDHVLSCVGPHSDE